MKKIIEFTVRMELDDTHIAVSIVDLNEAENVSIRYPEELPLDTTDVSINATEYVSNIAYHGSEEEWYITYKE